MTLRGYIARRAIYTLVLFIAVVSLNFFIFRIMPADPVLIFGFGRLSGEQMEALSKLWGLDKPLLEQFYLYLSSTFRGEFGLSFVSSKPVIKEVMARLPNTILLIAASLPIALILGIFAGVIAGTRPGQKSDTSLLTTALGFYSAPQFWLATIFLFFFAYLLGAFPLGGTTSRPPPEGFIPLLGDLTMHAILPVLVLALGQFGSFTLIMRNTIIDEFQQDYITTARAKGLSERTVMYKHALRNAMLPVTTFTGLQVAFLLSGTVLVETVFSWYGVGRYIFTAVFQLDYPVLQALFLIIATIALIANFIVDVLYGYLDPRVKGGI